VCDQVIYKILSLVSAGDSSGDSIKTKTKKPFVFSLFKSFTSVRRPSCEPTSKMKNYTIPIPNTKYYTISIQNYINEGKKYSR